ncbi:3' terminal RNA ribose 2'-O-methyltransferase Hen1 [Oerskovia sp. NPDC057915]|uniref:3' terminal RNA ribose 2'-O-methyltransferase Hen1 n=1 Tax=Oerskovia sp. NPDC057915 TaxID=3346280 RepID=UPI0036DD80CE
MLVTLTTTAGAPAGSVEHGAPLTDATDLGYLLHKHPARAQSFDLPVGTAHVFYPEADAARCTVALLLEVDPVGIVRNKRFGGRDAFSLAQYVNDRPYAASSMLAVALGAVFRTAMTGRCDSRQALADGPVPLEIHVPALPCRGGAALAERLFEPLGWTVEAAPEPLDPTVPEWGDSRYVDLRLRGTVRLADALHHLYVLLPVLDDAKHYWVTGDEVDKLLRAGEGWLADHPERDQIMRRYLAHQRRYVEDATDRLVTLDGGAAPEDAPVEGAAQALDAPAGQGAEGSGAVGQEKAPTLARQRAEAVVAALHEVGARSVVDLGCGEGALLRLLAADRRFVRVLGTDVAARELEKAASRLRLEDASDTERERVRLVQSSLTYRDERIAGFDAAVLMEVIEHVDPPRLGALERVVFAEARPGTVVVTTPNVEYNALYPSLGEHGHRHTDHRFEWTRAELQAWADGVAHRHGYAVTFRDVGPQDVGPGALGSPTQMALFVRSTEAGA